MSLFCSHGRTGQRVDQRAPHRSLRDPGGGRRRPALGSDVAALILLPWDERRGRGPAERACRRVRRANRSAASSPRRAPESVARRTRRRIWSAAWSASTARSDPSRFASAFSTRALLVAISAVTCSADTWSGHRDASTTLRNYADALPLEDERIRSNERFSASNANLSLSRSKVADDLMEQLACHAGFRRRVHKASSGAKCSLDVHGPNSFRPATRPSDRRADVPATGRSVRFVVTRTEAVAGRATRRSHVNDTVLSDGDRVVRRAFQIWRDGW